MSQEFGQNHNQVYKLVLTGGPCGGKTTCQARISSFFENIGWKVYRVPETATVLMSGGVKWSELSDEDAFSFQCNLIKTMMTIENTYFELAKKSTKNCLMVCDRGTMDASAYMSSELWERLKQENGWNEVDLRDDRYNQVIHMVTAAKGAEQFYTTDHTVRYEGPELARELDDLAAQAWVGHPYYDVIDNSTDFESKVIRTLGAVCSRIGLDFKDRLSVNSKKKKFLVAWLPELQELCQEHSKKTALKSTNGDICKLEHVFPQFQDFDVVHDYLVTPGHKMQARLRKRGQNGCWSYTHTIRREELGSGTAEVKMHITSRDYQNLLAQRDERHHQIVKKRRCFLWNDQYFQMDIYTEPKNSKCKDLVLLETYTSRDTDSLQLPEFLNVMKEVTGDPEYSMYNLSFLEGMSDTPRSARSKLFTRERKDSSTMCDIDAEMTNGYA